MAGTCGKEEKLWERMVRDGQKKCEWRIIRIKKIEGRLQETRGDWVWELGVEEKWASGELAE